MLALARVLPKYALDLLAWLLIIKLTSLVLLFRISIEAYLGLARTIYIRCIYGIFCREITEYTVIYGVYIYGSGQP